MVVASDQWIEKYDPFGSFTHLAQNQPDITTQVQPESPRIYDSR